MWDSDWKISIAVGQVADEEEDHCIRTPAHHISNLLRIEFNY
jgi:hypothetical protein